MIKKITNKALFCVIIIIVGLSFIGCVSEEENTSEYINNELLADNLFKEAEESADKTLIGNSVCIVSKDMKNKDEIAIQAPVALLINRTDNICIYAKNPFKVMYPASLTKVMTALGAFNMSENMKEETAKVSKNAANITESGAKLCGFREGDQVNLYNLVTTMLVYSGNDAAMAVAEHVSNTEQEFCEKMTKVSKSIGASHSNFINSHGLHNDKHYSTAYDMYLILNYLLKYKDAYTIAGENNYTLNYKTKDGANKNQTFKPTNKYILGTAKAPDGVTVLAGKTGTTNNAGNCLILVSKDANNKEYISVVLKAPSSNQLYSDMTKLLSLINK